MGGFPDRERQGEHFLSQVGEDEDAAPFICGVGIRADQASPLKGLQGRGERGSIHGEQIGYWTHRRRLGAIQRHEERELPIGQAEGSQDFVESTPQRARRPLHVKAEAGIPDEDGGFIREGIGA